MDPYSITPLTSKSFNVKRLLFFCELLSIFLQTSPCFPPFGPEFFAGPKSFEKPRHRDGIEGGTLSCGLGEKTMSSGKWLAELLASGSVYISNTSSTAQGGGGSFKIGKL